MPHVHDREGGADTRYAGPDIGEIFRRYGAQALERHGFTLLQQRVMRRIQACRTASLGGHLDVCNACGFTRPSYNSCRDRHCPKCQASRQAQWVALRTARMLPVAHYHVVFTVPGRVRALAKADPRGFFELLFRASSETLLQFGRDAKWLGGQLGVTSVLHTWTRDLQFHPHIHCVVTAGGLSAEGDRWLKPKGGATYLFPLAALGIVFRGKVLAGLRMKDIATRRQTGEPQDPRFESLIDRVAGTRWNVHTKQPLAASPHIFKYLGRYTHRVAISNQRLIAVDDDGVHFRTKDGKSTRLAPTEFIRRFLDHVLPEGFVKIRHYGLYSSGHINGRLAQARGLLPAGQAPATAPVVTTTESGKLKVADSRTLLTALTGTDPRQCPQCRRGTMTAVEPLPRAVARGPP